MLLLCVLCACADDSSDRQFAGDEQSTGAPTETAPPIPTAEVQGSPVALPTALSDEELFALRGTQNVDAFVVDGRLYAIGPGDSEPRQINIEDGWKAWLADVSDNGDQIAVVVGPEQSTDRWRMLILDSDGEVQSSIPIVGADGSAVASTEIVTTGTGGVDWAPSGDRIAVALPTGGIYLVTSDGTVEQMSPPRRVPRPGDLAWSNSGQAIAYTSKPDARSGLGVYVAPAAALPLDPVTILAPDSTGNRSARDVLWTPNNNRVLVILERRETGGSAGDVLSIQASGGLPDLVWSAGLHTDESGAQRISLSPDGEVLAILSSGSDDEAIVILRQLDGSAEVRQGLGVPLESASMIWTDAGLQVAGAVPVDDQPVPGAVLIDQDGQAIALLPEATPAAGSPVAVGTAVPASPIAAPAPASPVASPGAASPVASPVAASPIASPVSGTGD